MARFYGVLNSHIHVLQLSRNHKNKYPLSFASEMKRLYRTFHLGAAYATAQFRALLVTPSNAIAA